MNHAITDAVDASVIPVAAPQSAFRRPSAHVLFWFTAFGLLASDLWTKAWAFSALGPDEVRTFIPSVLEFRRSLNDGAVFGAFTGWTGLFVAASVFAVGFVVYLFATSSARHRVLHIALGMVLAGALGNLYDRAFVHADVIRFHVPHSGRAESFIGKIVGEPTANSVAVGGWPEGDDPRTFDRDEVEIRRQGVVRDFLKIVPRFPSWAPKAAAGRDVWPWVFNIADASLVCGVVLLLFFSGRHHTHRSEECAA